MTGGPWFPQGVRGARALRGTIHGAVRAGKSLSELLEQVQALYAQQGYQLRQQTRDAIERQYAQLAELESKGRALSRVPDRTVLGPEWISYMGLRRPLAEFTINPRLAVRGRFSGTIDGQPVDRWATFVLEGPAARGITVGEVRNMFQSYISVSPDTSLPGARDVGVDQLAVSAF
jgi:hypothetical protein